ncbi:MAG: hypothetical protein GY861_22185 [bacterium]|nr:hypothetical protein [bacterium]
MLFEEFINYLETYGQRHHMRLYLKYSEDDYWEGILGTDNGGCFENGTELADVLRSLKIKAEECVDSIRISPSFSKPIVTRPSYTNFKEYLEKYVKDDYMKLQLNYTEENTWVGSLRTDSETACAEETELHVMLGLLQHRAERWIDGDRIQSHRKKNNE